MARTPLVVGNWKMNTTVHEAVALVEQLRPALEDLAGVDCVVCPPFVALETLRERLVGSQLTLGAQNMYYEAKGAFTGEIAPPMLAGLVEWVILGHSERRQLFGETDDAVNRKVRAALDHDLQPIICLGETLAENEAGQTASVISRQLRGALAAVDRVEQVVLAYEPVWAIGSGRPATPEGANRVMGELRGLVADLYDDEAADGMRLLYGGSVTPTNFAAFMQEPHIDGGLVGGASLEAASFIGLARLAARTGGSTGPR